MTRPGPWIWAWAGLLIFYGLLLGVWSRGTPALLFLVAAVPIAVAAVLAGRGVASRRPRDGGLWAALLAAALVTVLIGLVAGVWLIIIGAELMLLCAFLLLRASRGKR